MFPNPYQEPIKKSPAQEEIIVGNYAVMFARALGVSMPLEGDVRAVERTGELARRWWRQLTLRSGV